MQKGVKIMFFIVGCLFLSLTVGCGQQSSEPDPDKEPILGMTDFVSADAQDQNISEWNSLDGDVGAIAPSEDDADAAQGKTVEEGDIYRILDNQMIVNLNRYRGLQLIDVSDLNTPVIVGNLRISGWPVEMYVHGSFAYLLMNNWRGYSGTREDIAVDSYYGGILFSVDISDPSSPQMVARVTVPDRIKTSRMVVAGQNAALYIAADQYNDGGDTIVQSFILGGSGGVTLQSTINLGGHVQDIQATPEAMLVARTDWQNQTNANLLAIIDISNPDGTMVQGADIPITGRIFHKSNMDLYKGVLRVVSGSWWRETNTNHLQTFNVADIHNPKPIDHATFGDGQGLEATLFLGNKAFVVTYRRVDPFHTFEIDDQGYTEEKVEYIISGWNDFFRAVSNQTRLIGIGKNDDNGSNMAVSLYDISDLSNPDPFIARSTVNTDNSWSEANWDDRAFSVLENAVSVFSKDVEETGLILLPFHGYKQDVGHMSGVQIFTFSDQTLTRRGMMEQPQPVRRSFPAQSDVVANLSDSELSLFDHTNPDEPLQLSRLELSSNYTDFMIFNDYGVRLKSNTDYYGVNAPGIAQSTLQVVELNQHPDEARPVAELNIPVHAMLFKVNHLIVTAEMKWENDKTTTRFQVYDFSDPTHPRPAGSLTTDIILPYYYPYYYEPAALDDVGLIVSPSYYNSLIFEMDISLVMANVRWERELVGEETVCRTYVDRTPETAPTPAADASWAQDTTLSVNQGWYNGSITCRNLPDEEPDCSGTFSYCQVYEDNCVACDEIDPATIKTVTECSNQDRYEIRQTVSFDVLDVTDPENPRLGDTLEMPMAQYHVGIQTAGNILYYNYKIPYTVEGDDKTYSKYYFKAIDYSNPLEPVVGPGINIPGKLLKIDGVSVFTHDYFWQNNTIESSLNRLVIKDDQAQLAGHHPFNGQYVMNMLLDNRGYALVSHRAATVYVHPTCPPTATPHADTSNYLSVLDTKEEDLPTIGKFAVNSWADMRNTQADRALFSVPGGLLIVNIQEPTVPFAQAFFPVMGWPNEFILHDLKITFAADWYGIYQFGLDEYNLD